MFSDIETVRLIVRDELLKNGNGKSVDKHLTHEDMGEVIGTNFSQCPSGNCTHGNIPIKSNRPTKEFKTCRSCKSNATPKSSSICQTCGKGPGIAEDPGDYFEDSDIEVDEIL